MNPRRSRLWFLVAFWALALLNSAAFAQINVTESTVASGDFVIGEGRVSYKFTIEGARTGASQAEAYVAPYWYIIYARGVDMYGNVFYQQLAQGPTNELYGAITGTGGKPATTQTFEGSWSSGDVTLLNYFPLRPNPQRFTSHQIVMVLYGDGVTPATAPADNATFLAPNISRAAGEIYWYMRDNTGPDLEMQGMTYNAGTYEGGDVIRMTTTWRNLMFPLGGYRQEIYKVHNYLTENAKVDWRAPSDPSNPPDAVVPDNDDFLMADYTMLGDRPIVSPVDTTPIVPDGSSIVRTIQVQNTPTAIPAYGIINTTVPYDPTNGFTYYDTSLRLYQPQPDDGWLDVGESVSVTVEVKVPQNYQGTYFVAGRVDPENNIPEPVGVKYVNSNLYLELTANQPDNNTFVSNPSAKITIDPSQAPTVEAVSAIAFQDGQYVQGGGETSNESSVSADGNVIAFSSASRNLLVPPQLAQQFIELYGRGADMSDPSVYIGGNFPFTAIQPYLTAGQQIFYRLRQTRENYLASGLAGTEANANCFNPSISSASGRYIAYDSRASNLGVSNTGNRSFIYIADVEKQTLVAVSRASGTGSGTESSLGALANGDCFNPSLSANGRFVTFESLANNLDPLRPLPANYKSQIYLHDRDADGNGALDEPGAGKTATYLVSVGADGKPANGACVSSALNPTESSTRMYVAYVSTASSLPGGTGTEQVFRVSVDVAPGSPGPDASSVLLVSQNTNGEPSNRPPGAPNGSIEPSISGDGTQIAFSSAADNLVYNTASGAWDADTNHVPDVFVRNLTLSPADPEFILKGLVRVSESIPRVATGTIAFTGPSTSFIDPLDSPYVPGSFVNIPQNNPQQGDFIEITSNGLTRKFVFVQPDSVAAVTVSKGGSGYTSLPTVTISPPLVGGTQAQATAVLGSGASAGRVVGVIVTNVGSGYTTVPTVTFSGGGGSGAAGFAVLGAATGGPVANVDVVSGGTGYTSPPTPTFSGGGGTGATAQAVLGTGATAGQVVRIDVISGGSGYTAPPTVTLVGGGGTGAAAVAVLNRLLTGPDVPVSFPQPVGVVMGNDVFTTRDALINAINAEPGLNLQAYATTPPTSTPNMAYTAAIYLRSLVLGEGGNGTITFTPAPVVPPATPVAPVVVTTDLTGGGVQAEDAVLAVQGVPAGSNQPSISEDGRLVAFRSIAGNLDVNTLTADNDFGGGPPYNNVYQPSPRQGELIRPILFPASNVYVRNRQDDKGLAGFDQEGNVSTTRVSLNNFGYPTTVSAQQGAGLGAFTTAANQAPAVGGNGRVISFSSGSEIYGGLTFGRNNLEPLDFQNARDVYVYDSQNVGEAPPPTESRPEVKLLSPKDGSKFLTGSTIALAASAIPKLGKSISSVQFYVNGAAVGAPLTTEPYSLTYKLANPGQYVVRVVATDSRGVTGIASSIITAGDPKVGSSPLVAITQPPSQVSNYVVGSDLVFNATAEDKGTGAVYTATVAGGKVTALNLVSKGAGYSPNTKVLFEGGGGSGAEATVTVDVDGGITAVTVTDGGSGYSSAPNVSFSEIKSVTFYLNGTPLDGIRGFDANWYVPFRPSKTGTNSLFAAAEDVDGNTGISEISTITFFGIGDTFPTVEILGNNVGLPKVAGGVYPLRARVTFQSPTFPYDVNNSSVLFYADGVYLGLGVLQADGTYLLNWQVPETPRTYGKIYAYLSAPNWAISTEGTDTAAFYANVVVRSKNSLGPLTFEDGVLPDVSLIKPANNAQIPTGVPTLLEATASVTNGQGTIAQIEFYQNGVLIGAATNSFPYQAQFVPPSPGQYIFTALAYTTAGLINQSDPVTNNAVTGKPPTSFLTTSTSAKATAVVNTNTKAVTGFTNLVGGSGYKTNAAPDVRLVGGTASTNTNATVTAVVGTNSTGAVTGFTNLVGGNGYTNAPTVVIDPAPVAVSPTSTVLLEATATDTDGTIRQVDFMRNGVVVGTATNAPYNFNLPVTAAGRYELIARATDNLGNVTDSPYIVVSGVRGAAPTVSISSPSDGLKTPLVPVNVFWTAADSDGSVVRTELLVNGVGVYSTNLGSGNFTYSFPSEGLYKLVVRATDNLGNVTDSAPVTVTVDNTFVDPTPRVALDPRTLVDQGYVIGSILYFNATAIPRGSNTIVTNSVGFTLGTQPPLPGTPSKIFFGTNEVYAAAPQELTSGTPRNVRAQAKDSAGNFGISDPQSFYYANPFSPLPSVDMLTRAPGEQEVAGGVVQLRAKAYLPVSRYNSGTSTTSSRVEFYANGALLGSAQVNTNQATTDSFTHFLNWTTPTNTNSYRIEARVVQLNFVTPAVDANGNQIAETPYFGASISPAPRIVNLSTNTAPTIAITNPSTNGAKFGVGITSQIVASVTTATNASVKEVQWYVDGLFVTNNTTFPYVYNFAPTNTGLYNIAAVVVDSFGLQGSTTNVRTVSAVSGNAPTSFLTTSTSAKATAVVNTNTKAVTGFTNLVGGSGYTLAPDLRLVGGGGSNATASTLINSNTGSVTNFTSLVGGTNYTIAPTVVIDPPAVQVGSVGGGGTNTNSATGASVLLQAAATDADGTIKQVDFLQNGLIVGTVTNAPYNFLLPVTAVGRYELIARATDNLGNVTDSPYIVLNGVKGTPPTVTITSPPDGAELPYGSIVNLQYTSSDPEGSVEKIELLRNGVNVRTLQAPNPQLVGNGLITDTPPSLGVYNYVVRATDNLGNVTDSAPVIVKITANATSRVPIVSIMQQSISDRAYVSGSRFFLNGQAQAQGTNTIKTDSFKFNLNGREFSGAPSGLDYGLGEVFTKLASADDLVGPASNPNLLTALAVDSSDQTGVSPATALYTAVSQEPLPSVTMLNPIGGSSQVAGGNVKLSASVVFPSSTPDQRRVEFYANGVYLGESTEPPVPDPQNPNVLVYSFLWKTPSDSASFSIQARAVALNFSITTATDVENNDFYGSSVSLNSVALNTIPGTAPVVEITAPLNGSDVTAGVPFPIQAVASVPIITNITAPFGPVRWSAATNTNGLPRYSAGDNVTNGSILGSLCSTNPPYTPFYTVTSPTNGQLSFVAANNLIVTNGQTLATLGGGNIQRIEFYANGQFISSDTNTPYTSTCTPASPGPYTLVAHAYSTDGLLGVSAPVSVNSKVSSPPTVKIVSPPNESKLAVNQPVTLVATASDKDGSVVSVNFEVNGVPSAGTLSDFGAWTGTFTPTSGGIYSVVAIATDNSGNETRSAPPTVYTVDSSSTLQVNLTSPDAGGTYTLGTPVLLAAAATTTIGSITGLQFYVNNQPVGTLLTAAPYFFSFSPPGTGTYTVFALATDSNGVSQPSDKRTFTVENAPDTGVPTMFLSAPSNSNLTSGSQVYLNYTVFSADPKPIPIDNVKIYVDGIPQSVVRKIGPKGDTFSATWIVGTKPTYSVFATVRDAAGTTAFSGVTTIQTTSMGQPPPLVEILPFESAYPYLAVDVPVKLKARANFRDNTAPQVLEFYANGVFVGPGIAGTATNGLTTYSLDWAPPIPTAEPAIFTGSIATNATNNTLTVASIVPGSGSISAGMAISGSGVATNTVITASVTGTGGLGTYLVNTPKTVSTNQMTAVGTVAITARAAAVNKSVPTGSAAGSPKVDYVASTISANIVNPPVVNLRIFGVPAPDAALKKQNGQFVIWMINELLYREPTYPEYNQYLAMLGGNPTANGSVSAKADVVMRIMGFDATKNIFNPQSEYNKTSAVAFAPYGRLDGKSPSQLTPTWPLTPTKEGIINFISLMESDASPLPLGGTYAGIIGAPWRATYGMARAMQSTIFDSVEFNNAYPTVSGFFGMDFVLWMAGNTTTPVKTAYMFPGRPDGGNARVDLANMIDDTPTLTSLDAFAIRQGAGAAFQSEFVAAMLWSGLAGTDPNSVEKNFQLKLNSASLNFQLSGMWNFAGAASYSKSIVQTILVNTGYADPAPAVAARTQTISFKLPSSKLYVGRTYTLSAKASSSLPVTFSLDESSASIATLVGNKLTITGSGTVTVIATQAGGEAGRTAKQIKAGTVPVAYQSVSVPKSAPAIKR